MKILFPLAVSFGLVYCAHAQDPTSQASSPPLTGTLVARLPEFARWSTSAAPMTSEEKSTAPVISSRGIPKTVKTAGRPPAVVQEKVVTTKTRGVIHVELIEGENKKYDEWHQGDFQITERPEWSEPLISSPTTHQDVSYTDYSKSDFPVLNWVSRKNYKGIEPMEGHACLCFRDQISATPETRVTSSGPGGSGSSVDDAEAKSASVPVEAYVDYYSRLPVKVVINQETRYYSYVTPPNQEQTLPERIVQRLETRRKQLKELSSGGAKP